MTIPFVWKVQPYEDHKYWRRCRHCMNAVRALQWHVWLRGGWWRQFETPE